MLSIFTPPPSFTSHRVLSGGEKEKFRRGFTLVELLVVIAIIGMLVGLLLPAVQQAREAARNMQCANHSRQMALAAHNHLSALGYFPSAGWHYTWIGEPECGYGMKQPGGWVYNLLDYMEQSSLRNLGYDLSGSARITAMTTRLTSPLPFMHCPSRRSPSNYPLKGTTSRTRDGSFTGVENGVKCDYGANHGSEKTLSEGNNDYGGSTSLNVTAQSIKDHHTKTHGGYTGVMFAYSQIVDSDIRDGLSNTYLFGEKLVNADNYFTGKDNGDNETGYAGHGNDSGRLGSYAPEQDRLGRENRFAFGSTHAGGLNMAFADGSVQRVSYSVDPKVHWCLSNRNDGNRYQEETDFISVTIGNF